MTILQQIAVALGYLTTMIGFSAFIWRFWKKIQNIANGQRCLLRSEIMAIYYRHCDEEEPTLREYERKNLDSLFEAYTELHGNTFVSDIYNKEMRHWHVST